MGKYRQKKQVVKEAFEIRKVFIQIPSGHFEAELENNELFIGQANQGVSAGDFIVTQSPTDRYHCPRDVFLAGYEEINTNEPTNTTLNPSNTTTK